MMVLDTGVFGVELFVRGDTVYFSEISPRPLIQDWSPLVSQEQSEFALHAKAILGLPITGTQVLTPGAQPLWFCLQKMRIRLLMILLKLYKQVVRFGSLVNRPL